MNLRVAQKVPRVSCEIHDAPLEEEWLLHQCGGDGRYARRQTEIASLASHLQASACAVELSPYEALDQVGADTDRVTHTTSAHLIDELCPARKAPQSSQRL